MGVHGRQSVEEIVGIPGRGRVPQRTQRVQSFYGLPGLVGLHVLRFVHYNYRRCGLDELYWPAARHPVYLLVNYVGGFVEGVYVHHEYLELVGGGELPEVRYPPRVVGPRVERDVIVEAAEMGAGNL